MTHPDTARAAYAETASAPPIEARIAAATGYELTDDYLVRMIAEARQGEFATLYGVSGHFAGSTAVASDRAQLDAHFAKRRLGNAYHVADHIARYRGPEIRATDFYRHDEASAAQVTQLVANGHLFAITGTANEIDPDRLAPSIDRDLRRQIWVPLSDNVGRLPMYLRFTGPAQDVRERRSSYLQQDWLILPQLVIPEIDQ